MSTAAATPRLRSSWSRALGLLWGVSPALVLTVLAATAVTALVPVLVVVLTTTSVQAVTEEVARGTGTLTRPVLVAALSLGGLLVLAHVASVVREYVEVLLQSRLANAVNLQIMARAVEMELADFEDPETYDSLQRANREAAFRPYQIFADLVSTLSSAVSLLSVGAVVLVWHPWVGLALLLAPVPVVLSDAGFGRRWFAVEHDRSTDRRRGNYLQYLATHDRAFKETRLLRLGPVLLGRLRTLLETFYDIDRSLHRRQALVSGGLGLLGALVAAGAVVLAARQAVGVGDVGRFAGFVAAVGVVQSSARGTFAGLAQIYEHNLFIGNLFAFLDRPTTTLPSGPRPFPHRLTQGIEFRGVSFWYPGHTAPALDDLHLTIPAGTTMALVGPNGAGKTTLVKLLARMYEPTSGQILVDGVPIEEYDLEGLRAGIGVIFQDFMQYEATARENIGFGRVSAMGDDRAVLDAARRAGAGELVEGLPSGLDTQLGKWFDDGQQLSGGQWQRVALARAFMRDGAVVVLDEPTASIDAAAEAEIFAGMRQLAAGATTLLVAHRFSTVRVADRIAVLEQGRLVELGDHYALLEADGMYAKLFHLQASGYLDDRVAP